MEFLVNGLTENKNANVMSMEVVDSQELCMIEETKTEEEAMDCLFDSLKKWTGVSKDQILSKTRKRYIVDARQMCCKIMHKVYNLTLEKSGNNINRNHATVMHAIKSCNAMCETDTQYKRIFEMVVKDVSEMVFRVERSRKKVVTRRDVFLDVLQKMEGYNSKKRYYWLNKFNQASVL